MSLLNVKRGHDLEAISSSIQPLLINVSLSSAKGA
jgi:hypothetical protein